MKTKLSGNNVNINEDAGDYCSISVPVFLAKTICEDLQLREAERDLVDGSYLMHKLHMTKRNFQNWVCKIPRSYYTVLFNNTKLFFLSKMLGLKSSIRRLGNYRQQKHKAA